MTVSEESDIYFFPLYTEEPQENYLHTFALPVPSDTIAETTGQVFDDEAVHIWGNKTGRFEDNGWDVSAGDVLMFYTQSELVSYGLVDSTVKLSDDEALSLNDNIWPHYDESDLWDYIFFVREAFVPTVSREEVRQALGYNDLHRHARCASYDAKQGLVEAYGGMEAFLRSTTPDPKTATGTEGSRLLEWFDDTDTPAQKFTAPPDYWLCSLANGAIGFAPEDRGLWDEIERGSFVLFHAAGEMDTAGVGTYQSGLIGAGIVGQKYRKPDSEDWWPNEVDNNANYSHIVGFDRIFLTGDIEGIDTSRPFTGKDAEQIRSELTALMTGGIPPSSANAICERVSGNAFPAQGSYGTFRTADGDLDYDRPRALVEAMAPRLTEAPAVNVGREFTGSIEADVLDGLHFPDDRGEEIIDEITAALQAGKHIVLTGPPGTGKTEIARRVCAALPREYPYLYSGTETTTATADWSTFDTVGGYMPEADGDGDDLAFTPGVVLNRFKQRGTDRQLNEPLLIDELNRADIDKSFGQLFTLLSGQSVTLPFTRDGEEVELVNPDDVDGAVEPHQYLVPESWRLFATMNSYDKTSLYEMSYAFMRRFAFIRVEAPTLPEDEGALEELMAAYDEVWDIEGTGRPERLAVGRVWRAVNGATEERSIGPAIVRDVLGYVSARRSGPGDGDLDRHLTEAVLSYVFPQLEGVPKRGEIVRAIAAVDRVDTDRLGGAAREMLQVDISDG